MYYSLIKGTILLNIQSKFTQLSLFMIIFRNICISNEWFVYPLVGEILWDERQHNNEWKELRLGHKVWYLRQKGSSVN